jgi:predicted RNase H-like nuclease
VAKAPLVESGDKDAPPRLGDVELKVCPTWLDVVKWCRGCVRIAVDMPIGLPERAEPGGRPFDRACRKLLRAPDGGPGRSSSVFSAPVRGVLKAKTYEEALAISRASSEHNIGLSKQTWNIVPKIREIDEWMTPARARRVFECHPEVVFAMLNADEEGRPRAMNGRKVTADGRSFRWKLLRSQGVRERELMGSLAASADDVLDSLACVVGAWDFGLRRSITGIGREHRVSVSPFAR